MILIPFYQSKYEQARSKLVAKHERVRQITKLVLQSLVANRHLQEFATSYRISLHTPFDKGPAELGMLELPKFDNNRVQLGVHEGPVYVDGNVLEVLLASAKNDIEYKIVIAKPSWEDKPAVHEYVYAFDESQDDAGIAAKIVTTLATIAQEITK